MPKTLAIIGVIVLFWTVLISLGMWAFDDRFERGLAHDNMDWRP